MKAVVFRGIGDVALETVKDPTLKKKNDAIVRITSSAICGTDLHFLRGTFSGMKPGRILGHEAVGIVEEAGAEVRNFRRGDRVIIPSTVGCGACRYCREGIFAQCDQANPLGRLGGTVFFGGPENAGGLDGLQAEYARVPFAETTLVPMPHDIHDDAAVLMSDILPTSFMAAEMAAIEPGNSVAIFGCGPVGLFAIECARHLGAGRIFAIDTVPSRLAMAQAHGAEAIDYRQDDPVATLLELTSGWGPDRVIDAVGVDAHSPSKNPLKKSKFKDELKQVAPKIKPDGENWRPGGAPSQVLEWAVEAVAKNGVISVIGVYPPTATTFPIGAFMNKNLRLHAGNCNHRRYMPRMIELVRSGIIHPERFLTQIAPIASAIEAYRAFDRHEHGWVKVKLDPTAAAPSR